MHRYDGTEKVTLPDDAGVEVNGKNATSLKPGDEFEIADLSALFGVVPMFSLTEV